MRAALRQDNRPAQSYKLSILICALPTRLDSLAALYRKLNSQKIGRAVEIITLTDFKDITVGEKRNLLVQMAAGDYVAFIDDDDDVSDDYVSQIMEAIDQDPDCVSIKCWETTNGKNRTLVNFTIEAGKNHRVGREKFYLPNHICAIRSRIAKEHKFEHINLSEDHKWAAAIQPDLKREVCIGPVYFYNFVRSKSETRR